MRILIRVKAMSFLRHSVFVMLYVVDWCHVCEKHFLSHSLSPTDMRYLCLPAPHPTSGVQVKCFYYCNECATKTADERLIQLFHPIIHKKSKEGQTTLCLKKRH